MIHKHGPVYDLRNCIECCRVLWRSASGNIDAQLSMLAHIASIPESPAAAGAQKRLSELRSGK